MPCQADRSALTAADAPCSAAATVTVGDSAGQAASDSGSVTFSLLSPSADLLDSDTRAQSAPATAGIAAADYPPGEYETRAVVRNAEGATATDTGRIEIPGPAVDITQPGSTARPGDGIAATVTPDDGTTLQSCSVEVQAGGVTRIPAASLVDGRCTSAIPATVTVTATDSAGETRRSSRDLTVPPVASLASPSAPRRLGNVYLACGSRSVALVDVAVSGKRVKLLGAARSPLIGRAVELRKVGAKKVVARATVGKDGLFSATGGRGPVAVAGDDEGGPVEHLHAPRAVAP